LRLRPGPTHVPRLWRGSVERMRSGSPSRARLQGKPLERECGAGAVAQEMHHFFTAPRPQDLELLEGDPAACRAVAYDLVINGSEAGGGTIRIHDGATQEKVFRLLGISAEVARERFGFLLDALRSGAPPHGGIALGIDRWVMLFGGLDSIREVIAFPKTQKASDLMTGAPGTADAKQLTELGIRVVAPPAKPGG
jgi:aspartyl-tRNA synthetase